MLRLAMLKHDDERGFSSIRDVTVQFELIVNAIRFTSPPVPGTFYTDDASMFSAPQSDPI